MKKIFILVALSLGLFAFIFITPKILKTQDVQKQVSEKINQLVGLPTEMGEISLHWLPLPYLAVHDLKSSTDNFSLDLPELQIVPAWKSIFKGVFTPARLKLIEPTITIKSFQTKTSGQPFNLNDLKIIIKNGTIISPAATFSNNIITKKNKLSDVQIDLSFQQNRCKFNLAAKSNFCEKFTSIGRIDLKRKYYRITSKVTNFNLAGLLKSYNENIQPTNKKINLSLFAEGMTLNNFKIALKGDLPPFRIKGVDWFSIQTNQCKTLSFEKYGHDFFIKMDDVQLASPALHLNGSISRKMYTGQIEPIWDLDLSAKEIDLSQARNFVLKQWGKNIIAKEVCGIVLGGKAHSAKYLFQGPVTDFKYIEKMKIIVDVADSAIFIPHIDLSLDSAIGKIAIVNGKLSGHDLSATIGSSIGKQGNLLLDLQHIGKAFKLDLNLDVDGAKLKKVLGRIISNNDFLNELHHFTDITGRAKGHLFLGDELHNIQARVSVDSTNISGRYNRLPWPFEISAGEISIAPTKASWQDIGLTLGPHTIKESSGYVDWHKKNPYLKISSLAADFATNALLNDGSLKLNSSNLVLRSHLSEKIKEIWGRVSVNNFSLDGPALHPGEWQYSFSCQTDDLKLSSLFFPETIQSQYLSGNIDNKRIQLTSNVKLFKNHLNITANYSHTFFSQWSGTTKFTGLVGRDLMDWLNETAHIPSAITLRPPLNLEDIKLTTSTSHPARYKVAGRLSLTPANSNAPYLQLSLNHQKNSVQTTVDFVSPESFGSISYRSKKSYLSPASQGSRKISQKKLFSQAKKPSKSPNDTTKTSHEQQFSWKGAIDAKTLELFFNQQPFKSGTMNGTFAISQNDSPKNMLFSGELEAKDVIIEKNSTQDYPTFSRLKISGLENTILIDKAEIIMPESPPITLSGSISPGKTNISGDLSLTTDKISSLDILNFAEKFNFRESNKHLPITKEPDNDSPSPQTRKIAGQLAFKIKNFIFLADENKSSKHISFTPLRGILKQKSPVLREITLTDSKRCGIIVNGTWLSDNGTESGNFTLTNSEGQTFQTTLPCLGAENSIIEGEIGLEVKISGSPGNWQNGEVSLHSSCGIIHRMDLLSKIFSLINFTEIFAFNDLPNLDKDGLLYNDLRITGKIIDNVLHIETATLKGKGLNISAKGTINLNESTCNLTLFIAPFKMVDSIVTNIPLIGRIVGGKKEAILTFPVRVEGKLDNPTITAISPTAIGKATFNFIKETLALPFTLFSPLPGEESPTSAQP